MEATILFSVIAICIAVTKIMKAKYEAEGNRTYYFSYEETKHEKYDEDWEEDILP